MRYLHPVILLLSISCLLSWSGCSSKKPQVVTLLDSHRLLPAYDEHCQPDNQRVRIDKGYLRAIIDDAQFDKELPPH